MCQQGTPSTLARRAGGGVALPQLLIVSHIDAQRKYKLLRRRGRPGRPSPRETTHHTHRIRKVRHERTMSPARATIQ